MLLRWYRVWRKRRVRPSHGVFSEHVGADGSIRRYARVVDIRASAGGHKLSFEMVMILVLAIEPGWTFLGLLNDAE